MNQQSKKTEETSPHLHADPPVFSALLVLRVPNALCQGDNPTAGMVKIPKYK